jgi:hypothetical protein
VLGDGHPKVAADKLLTSQNNICMINAKKEVGGGCLPPQVEFVCANGQENLRARQAAMSYLIVN